MLEIKKLTSLEKLGDAIMRPIMWLMSGAFDESPQLTHRWNNKKLTTTEINELAVDFMIEVKGMPAKIKKNVGVCFHLPIFGGWRNYAVIAPVRPSPMGWYVGWCSTCGATGVSRIKIFEPARLLVGPHDVYFFGVDCEGTQIAIKKIGRGVIGQGGPFAQRPLL